MYNTKKALCYLLLLISSCCYASSRTLWNDDYQDGEYLDGPKVFKSEIYFKISEHSSPWRETFYALNSNNGKIQWKIDNAKYIRYIGPISKNGIIYLGTHSANFVFKIIGIQHDKGNIVWESDVLDENLGAIEDIKLSPDEQTIFVTSSTGHIISVDSSGSVKWDKILGNTYISTPPIILNDGSISFGTKNGYLYFVNDKGIELLSERFSKKCIINSIAASKEGNKIYFTTNCDPNRYPYEPSTLFKIDIKTRNIEWKKEFESIHEMTVHSNGDIYLITDKSLNVVNKWGKDRWIFKSSYLNNIIIQPNGNSLIARGPYLLVINPEGKVIESNFIKVWYHGRTTPNNFCKFITNEAGNIVYTFSGFDDHYDYYEIQAGAHTL